MIFTERSACSCFRVRFPPPLLLTLLFSSSSSFFLKNSGDLSSGSSICIRFLFLAFDFLSIWGSLRGKESTLFLGGGIGGDLGFELVWGFRVLFSF